MSKYLSIIFFFLFLSNNVFSQDAFKRTTYVYSFQEEEDGNNDTLKTEVAFFNKDSLLLRDTLWQHDERNSMMATTYDSNEKKKLRVVSAGNGYIQTMAFERDTFGNIIEQIFSGAENYRLINKNSLDENGKLKSSIITFSGQSNGMPKGKSALALKHDDEGNLIEQKTIVFDKLIKKESWVYINNKVKEYLEIDLQNNTEMKTIYYYNAEDELVKTEEFSDNELSVTTYFDGSGMAAKGMRSVYSDGLETITYYTLENVN